MDAPSEPSVRLLVHLGRTLHTAGFSAPELEGSRKAAVQTRIPSPSVLLSNDTDPSTAAAERGPGASETPLVPGFWRRDPILFVALAGWLAVIAPYASYLAGGGLSIEYRDDVSYGLVGLLVSFACFADLGRVRSLSWRRLRILVGSAFGVWVVIEALELWSSTSSQGSSSVLLDSLWVFFYVLFGFAALDDRRLGEVGEARGLRRLRRAETALFVGGMFLYFVLIPYRVDPESPGSMLPTAFFYVALDGFLLGLFARRLLRTESPREMLRWRLFALAAALFLLTDALYFYALTGRVDLGPHPLTDLLWLLPYLAVLLAVRVAAAREPISGEVRLGESEPAPFAPSFLYAALVPATHLLAEATGVATAAAAEEQRTCALLLTVALGTIATLHQRRIVRLQEALHREVVAARRQLASAQKLEAIGRLSAGVAHDFNNLLTVVMGRAELLLGRSEEPAARRDLETIVRAAVRAADLTQELLAVGQRGMGVRQRVDLGALVTGCRSEIAEICGERIEIVTELEPSALTIEIDPSHLERVVRNLVSNARDAMPDGGRLRITTASRRFSAQELVRDELLSAGDYASLVFHDTGAGMDPETQRRLFEPFFTTKALGRGTGLGLATAYGLVRQNGGQIVVSSRVGDGARFEVLLPRAPATPPAAPAPFREAAGG